MGISLSHLRASAKRKRAGKSRLPSFCTFRLGYIATVWWRLMRLGKRAERRASARTCVGFNAGNFPCYRGSPRCTFLCVKLIFERVYNVVNWKVIDGGYQLGFILVVFCFVGWVSGRDVRSCFASIVKMKYSCDRKYSINTIVYLYMLFIFRLFV